MLSQPHQADRTVSPLQDTSTYPRDRLTHEKADRCWAHATYAQRRWKETKRITDLFTAPVRKAGIARKEIIEMTTEAETTPVPDCFFWRDRESEERGGYMLAGVLIVRRPWLSRSHNQTIAKLIQQIAGDLRDKPNLCHVVCNLDGTPTRVGDKLQDDAWLQRHFDLPKAKCQRITVRVDRDGVPEHIRISEHDMKMLFGDDPSQRTH